VNNTQQKQRDIYVGKGCKEMGFNPNWFEQREQILEEQEALITWAAQTMVGNFWAKTKERKRAGESEQCRCGSTQGNGSGKEGLWGDGLYRDCIV
jgi:hypothetical protein